jgi:molybdopterin-biosynthesis enzyme MoeA-like protein
MNQLKAIEKNAELVINEVGRICGVQLDYDEKSVQWLDGYIERNRKDFDEETVKK